jgi:Mg2+/Co2+ transporter CorC
LKIEHLRGLAAKQSAPQRRVAVTAHIFGRIPVPADHFIAAGFRFEVVDVDVNRVDKVLVMKIASQPITDANA